MMTLWASWNLACGGQLGLNRCVRFQSAKKPPTVVNAATEMRILRPELVRIIGVPPFRSRRPPDILRYRVYGVPARRVPQSINPRLFGCVGRLRWGRSRRQPSSYGPDELPGRSTARLPLPYLRVRSAARRYTGRVTDGARTRDRRIRGVRRHVR